MTMRVAPVRQIMNTNNIHTREIDLYITYYSVPQGESGHDTSTTKFRR